MLLPLLLPLPHRRILRAMKYPHHHDALVAYSKLDAIRETLRDSFVHIA